jgi:hypothetical protein
LAVKRPACCWRCASWKRPATKKIKDCVCAPDSYFIGSDVFYTFLSINNLVHWNDQKYKSEAEMRAEYPQIVRDFEASEFPARFPGRSLGACWSGSASAR